MDKPGEHSRASCGGGSSHQLCVAKMAEEPLAQPLLAESPVTESPLSSVLGSPVLGLLKHDPHLRFG